MSGTAIVVVHTQQGFVIAADGRKNQGDSIVTETEQKIFSICQVGKILAYAMAGISSLPDANAPNSTRFDFHRDAVKTSLSDMQNRHPLTFGSYVKDIARKVNRKLIELQEEEPELRFPTQGAANAVAHFICVGYYDGRPQMARVTFFQRRQRIARTPRVKFREPRGAEWEITMPSGVGLVLSNQSDPRLEKYYTENMRKLFGDESLSLAEAQDAAETCIRACCDPVAAEIDPYSVTVGGHIHIATITPEAGFRWIKSPTSAQ